MAASRRSLRATAVLLLLCTIVESEYFARVFAATRAQDVSALNSLVNAWTTPSPLNWNGDPCLNSWTGVGCDSDNTTVISLNLYNRKIQGSLPAAIGQLTNLIALEMSLNPNLGGQLPNELGNLLSVQTLSLQWCSFDGTIPPSLGNLTSLTFLGLNENKLTGSIPNSFGNLKRLIWLDISSNSLTGPIPVSSSPGSNGLGLDNMTNVKHFHFNDNFLNGSVPAEIFSLKFLIHLIVNNNQLQSTIPDEIQNSLNLTILRLDSNRLSGSIPSSLNSVTTLQHMDLHGNQLGGTLPNLSSLQSLQSLDVGLNSFSQQPFPSWASSLTQLMRLALAQSNVEGHIPPSIFNPSQLQELDLSNNHMDGSLDFVGETSLTLQTINLSNNSINGLSGYPQANGEYLSNIQIMLGGNPLCSNTLLLVQKLGCASNLIPGEWIYVSPSTRICDGLSCDGGLVLNRKNCTCGNPLSVTLVLTAPSFTNLTDERAQSMETEFASKLTDLKLGFSLGLNQVVIVNGVPVEQARYQLNLWFFALGNDSISLDDQAKIVTALNQRRITLFEGPFQIPGTDFSELDFNGGVHLSTGAIVGIVVGVLVVTVGLVAYAVRQRRRAVKAGKTANHPFAAWGGGSDEFGEAPKLKGARWFSLAELTVATKNWNIQNQIGEGGYGEVYEGVLKTGDIVAIKRAREGSKQGAAEFKNEIELLSRVHHRNLVGLVGFCYEDGEQALIYEFMNNGTLREHLLSDTYGTLTWRERLDIAFASARGLAYLHDHAIPPIIHRDVKSANILLNDKLGAKVSDFGLSKLAPDEGEKVVYSQTVKGTLGYLDPEYYMTQTLTDKSDVYSFGVVLLEMITAKPPIETGRFVVREVRTAMEAGGMAALQPLVDPLLTDITEVELEIFVKLALNCVEDAAADRQSMSDIVKQLEGLGGYASGVQSGVQKFNTDFEEKKKSPDFYTDSLFQSSRPSIHEKEEESERSFQYSGGFGVSTTVQPK